MSAVVASRAGSASAPTPLDDMLGESAALSGLRRRLARLLQRGTGSERLPPVLIEGETGTGKGLLARAIHRAGPRGDGPFVDVNCAAIPEGLLEAEMFGFERGAFTDARQAKPGLFQAAHRGTLFLDEIGLMPEALQAKLLTVLEERVVRRLGATRSEPADVAIVAATSEDLRRRAHERRFREDLYHRLAVLTVALPPLRRRGRDVLLLAEHFLARACVEYGLGPKTLSAAARDALAAYAWPGNVRELANLMERVALLGEAPEITPALLDVPAESPPSPAPLPTLDDAMRAHLTDVLARTHWNISRAASVLGISRNTLRARIERHDLRASRRGPARPGTPPAPPQA
ncbi:MAG: sigma 54-interacting transcriptional regulator, partial [Candidatus Rokuibacteriota bacterium]